MEISLSDLVDSCDEDLCIRIDTSGDEARGELRFLKEFKKFLKQHNKPTGQVDYLIHKIEGTMGRENVIRIFDIDEKSIKNKIEKHPYFKNPCDYPIRLVTIMKYLKKKGVDTTYKDIDLIVDKLIQEIEGVKKIGDGMYIKKSN